MKSFAPLCLCLCLCFFTFRAANAGTDPSETLTPSATPPDPFARGNRELSKTAGFLCSPVIATGGRPTFNYIQADLSLGWMLTSPSPLFGKECLRGNWEALANLCGMGVTDGSDGFMAGGRALIRYNFVQPGARWVPFAQIGAGVLGNNVYQDREQHLIGSGIEFTLVADVGVRYFITPKWAAVLMADFEHISNANTASRNLGVNAAGGMLGVSFFF